ncbi:MAG: hypothetical protein IPN71_12970 [Fibrobacteres bacterium]|nr:hypothetical protein [Fibrobacterota bacterium]
MAYLWTPLAFRLGGRGGFVPPVLLRLDGALFPTTPGNAARTCAWWIQTGARCRFRGIVFQGRDDSPSSDALAKVQPGRLALALRVRWGDPLAESVASPGEVFPGSHGWAGVWNLDRLYVDPLGRLRAADASTGRDDGVITGSPASDPEGGLRFVRAGTTGFSAAGDQVDFDHSFTVVWRLKPQEKGKVFLGWGDSVWRSGKKDFFMQAPKSLTRQAGWNPAFTARSDTGFNVYSIAEQPLDSARWTILCARLDLSNTDSAAVQWFMDGTSTGQTTTTRLRYQADLPRDSLVMGWRHADARRFTGSLSDLLILRRAMPQDWIFLTSALFANSAGLVHFQR